MTQPSPALPARFLTINKDYHFRPVESKDEETLYRLVNEEATRPYFMRPWLVTIDQERRFIKASNDGHQTQLYAIVTAADALVGVMGLHHINQQSRTAETGAMLACTARNKGLGQAAKLVLLYHAFMVLNLRQITSRVIGYNTRSYEYSRKCGYTEVGRIKEHCYWDGSYHDEVTLLVTRQSWQPHWERWCTATKRSTFQDMLMADGQLR